MRIEQVSLPDVTLSCAIAGASGPWVLALHGFPDCRQTFDPIVPALVSAGYRVVLPTLRGYAPSGVARSGHHAALAGDDLIALARHFAGEEPVRLIGHDWGAFAAFVACDRAPARFSHLVTMAVPHPGVHHHFARPEQLRRSWYIAMFQLPWVAEARLAKDDLALIDRLWGEWSPGYRASRAELAEVKAGVRDRLGPVLAYYRALRTPALRLAGPTEVPAIHLHGEDDGCVGIECTDGAERHYRRGYTLHRVKGAGHFLTRERPDEVARIVTEFLRPTRG